MDTYLESTYIDCNTIKSRYKYSSAVAMADEKEDIYEKTDYESLLIKHDPIEPILVQAFDIALKFVRERQLILTGGTAMDYALRLQGDKIYSDHRLVFPDIDAYSPTHVEDSYDLAELLTPLVMDIDEEFQVDAIRAMHITTMRVRLHYQSIVEFSYVPKNIYDVMPTLMYNGLRIIGPNWQKMNQHLALSFPLIGAPKEVIFHRGVKDVERFSMLTHQYPMYAIDTSLDVVSIPINLQIIDINRKADVNTVLYGFAAYAGIYYAYKQFLEKLGQSVRTKVIPLKISTTEFQSPLARSDYIVDDVKPLFGDQSTFVDKDEYMLYNPLMDYRLESYVKEDEVSKQVTTVHYVSRSYLPVTSIRVKYEAVRKMQERETIKHAKASDDADESEFVDVDRTFMIPCLNYVLLYMLLGFNTSSSDIEKIVYNNFYVSSLEILSHINLILSTPALAQKINLNTFVESSPFYISSILVGKRNVSESMEFSEYMLSRYANIGIKRDAAEIAVSSNYYPTHLFKAREKDPSVSRPKFDYSTSIFYAIDGLLSNRKPSIKVVPIEKVEEDEEIEA